LAGEKDDGKLGSTVAQSLLDLKTIDFGHRNVQDETGGTLLTLVGEKLTRAGETPNLKPLCAEQPRQGLQHLGLVIEQINNRFISHSAAPSAGKETQTMVPPAGADAAQTRPP
jgi:hypothetical protein